MPTFKITLAYDGTDFVGWQRQATGVSDSGRCSRTRLRELDGRDVDGDRRRPDRRRRPRARPGRQRSRSRATIDAPTRSSRALNARLPRDVRVLDGRRGRRRRFTRGSTRASKTYRYRIWNADVHEPVRARVRVARAGPRSTSTRWHAAARLLEGRHDFAAFQAAGSDVATTERDGVLVADRGCGPHRPRRSPSACSSTRSPATASCATWSAPSSGRWSRSGAAAGRPSGCGDVLASRDRARAGPTAPAARAVSGARRLRRRDVLAAWVLKLVQSRFTHEGTVHVA